MNRADRKKTALKEDINNFIDEYYYYLVATGIILVAALLGLIWTLFDKGSTRDFDINSIVEDKIGEYSGELIQKENGNSFIVVEGNLEDSELIEIQRDVAGVYNIQVPLYFVEGETEIHELVDFYEVGLVKRSEWINKNTHEVISYNILSSVTPDATTLSEWEIYEDESGFKDDTYVVRGKISQFGTSVDKLAQMSGLADMVNRMNEENKEADYENLLIHFETVPGDVYYHTDHKNILGVSDFFTTAQSDEEVGIDGVDVEE